MNKRSFLEKLSGVSRDDAVEQPAEHDYLDTVLLPLSDFENDHLTIRNACEGIHIFGATGSGKTSGSGETIAKAFLDNDFGGLVLTAKPEDVQRWTDYCRDAGRERDLIVFPDPKEDWTFNFLDYEYQREDIGAGRTDNVVQLFNDVLEVIESNQGGREDAFFKRAAKQLLRNSIDLLTLAKDQVTLPDIYAVITSAPQSLDDVDDPKWQDKSFCWSCYQEAKDKHNPLSEDSDFDITEKYWLQEFPSLADRTRSSIVITFTSMADSFLRGAMRQLFCTTKNPLVPERTHEGKIILLDLPVEKYKEIGQTAQVLFKYLWQRATSGREVDETSKPVFLWADEAQYFITSNDMFFQSTARSKLACTVYLTQNLSAYYAKLGDGAGRAQTDALLANFQTHIFHANIDHVTNSWAAETISKDVLSRRSFSSGQGERGTTTSFGRSDAVDYVVMPIEFTKLRKGGPENDRTVEAIILQSGRKWGAGEDNYLQIEFIQSLNQ